MTRQRPWQAETHAGDPDLIPDLWPNEDMLRGMFAEVAQTESGRRMAAILKEVYAPYLRDFFKSTNVLR